MIVFFDEPDYRPKGPFRLFVQDLICDTATWGDDERFRYIRLLDHLWTQGGWIPDDLAYIAAVSGINRVKNWEEKAILLKCKLVSHAEKPGFLTQKRVLRDLAKAFEISQKRAAAGQQGGRPTKASDKANEKQLLATSHKPLNREEGAAALFPPSENADECELAFQSWNILAHELGLAKAIKLSDGRRRQMKHRLKEAGGLEGWKAAIYKIRKSAFLMGQNDRGWKADLDFVLRESRFTKLIEGGYDNTNEPGAPADDELSESEYMADDEWRQYQDLRGKSEYKAAEVIRKQAKERYDHEHG